MVDKRELLKFMVFEIAFLSLFILTCYVIFVCVPMAIRWVISL